MTWRWIERLREEEGLEDLFERFGLKLPVNTNANEDISWIFGEVNCVLDIAYSSLPILVRNKLSAEFQKGNERSPAIMKEVLRLAYNFCLFTFSEVCPTFKPLSSADENEMRLLLEEEKNAPTMFAFMKDTPKCLPKEVCQLTQIKELSLSGIYAVPEEIANLTQLKSLTLSGRFRIFPEAVCRLTQLETFNFAPVALPTLPDSIGNSIP